MTGSRVTLNLLVTSGALVACTALAILWVVKSGNGQEKPSLAEVMERMKEYNRALGVNCDYCHIPDPKAPQGYRFDVDTPRKKTAKWMQEKVVDALVTREGNRIDCRTCHDGRARFLPSSQ